jgi:hypothetical protein
MQRIIQCKIKRDRAQDQEFVYNYKIKEEGYVNVFLGKLSSNKEKLIIINSSTRFSFISLDFTFIDSALVYLYSIFTLLIN